ncbi:hypothetical protein [Halarcobacter anaerophilus]|jgi:hypothetical protein|uniref:Uncharacterized protein n=1 Tax=Halarcobacter anaerophilus TaxID=877500 RepID=A0A4V1LPQ8_9BACT|nr:hypothetical protein [Halarcobacter anaerophilus]QDF28283.1 hypothetical protein AANAER_0790 [Halarcobacter anaerophilus]RXJ62048.1 hypothetical protein CRV06_11495 [Halarcobacter anaerophilus]
MKRVIDYEKYFIISEFEEGWGMEDIVCDEQLYDYCLEALFIPEEKIEELSYTANGLEIILCDLESEDISEDWYVNLLKTAKDK